MRRSLPLLLVFLSVAVSLVSQTVCNYSYRKRIAFDPARVSGSTDLTDFPALITFTADPDLENTPGGHVANTNGYDIIFTADDGITVLDHDLEYFDGSTGALTVWVKIPLLSTSINTYIYMYYGNAAIATNQSSSATWSNGYVGIWHFNNSLNNSSPTAGLNGTNNGSTNTATSKFTSARNFARASSQYVEVTPYNSAYDITSEITVSGWVRLASLGNDQKFAGNQNNVNGGWKFGVFSDNKIELEIRTSGNSPFLSRSAAGGAALAANTWYYVVGIYSDAGNFIRTYRNGVLDRNYNTNATAATSPGTLKFGREPFANTAYLDGIMDEFRLSNTARSADWIATEYENQNSPSTFYTIHPEPNIWDGSSSINWGTNANWSNGIPAAGEDVIIPNVANDPVLNVSASIGGMWIQNGGTFNNGTNTRTISIAYDVLNCGTYTGNNGHLRLNTNTIQVQHISGGGTYNLAKLIIDNQFFTSPTTKLNTPVSVSQSLTLLTGIVETDATNILALGTSAGATSGSSQSFIHGPMSKQGNTAFVFPIGKGQEWRRLRLSGITASSTFRAEYFDTPYTTQTPVTAPLDNVSYVEYWQLDRLAGAGSANVSLYWENVAYSGIDNCPDLTIARWNGTSWVEQAATEVAGSSCSGAGTGTIITNAVVTNFSPFTFGSTSASFNALPLTVAGFTAGCNAGEAAIGWTDMLPANTKRFFLERSADGYDFITVQEVSPRNSAGKAEYLINDRPGAGLWYYRVRQQDLNDENYYTQITTVVCEGGNRLNVFPNPSGGAFTVTGLDPGARFMILNAAGQVVYEGTAQQQQVEVSLNEKGIYLLFLPGSAATSAAKIIVH